ncbi:MAG: hypothetical protein ACKO9Z_12555 [Planctomycetota bacterium]
MVPFGKVAEHIVAEPFRPFRLSLSSGKQLDILNPEMILLGRNSVRIYTSAGKNNAWEDVPLTHMLAIDLINS